MGDSGPVRIRPPDFLHILAEVIRDECGHEPHAQDGACVADLFAAAAIAWPASPSTVPEAYRDLLSVVLRLGKRFAHDARTPCLHADEVDQVLS